MAAARGGAVGGGDEVADARVDDLAPAAAAEDAVVAGAEEHRRFYDEYNAVLDMPGEYYLDCVRIVFQQHLLPRGLWHVSGQRVDPTAITDTSLMTVEGELDDISGLEQTRAAHDLCTGLRPYLKRHHMQAGVGHYGVFSGNRWTNQIYPLVKNVILASE